METKKKLVVMMKARPYPEGTVRSWSGKKYIKKNGHWEQVAGDTSRKDAPTKARRKDDKKPARAVKGSKEMLTELKKLERGGRVFLDDLSGKRKKIFNSLTKDGLVKWEAVGKDDYKAVLSTAGSKAIDTAHAAEAKTKRSK